MSAIPDHPRATPGRLPLSPGRIVDTALTLAKEQGLAAVSMRRLAKELGVQPMSLYYHVPSRTVLMVLMAEQSLASVFVPPSAVSWDEQLSALMLGTYHAGVANPAVFPVLASETLGTRLLSPVTLPAGAASLGLIGRVQELLGDAGVPESARPGVCRGLFGLVVGFLVGQVDGLVPTGGQASPESSDDEADQAELRGDDPEPAPPEMRAMHLDDPAVDLANALRLFLRGLAAERPH